MAATTEQKVDFLFMKVGYSLSKTGSVTGTGSISGGTTKEPFAESIPSPLVIPDDSIWNQSLSIPGTPPGSTTAIVQVYPSSGALRLTADSSVSGSRAFIAYTTYNNTSTPILGDWIDTQFGTGYVLKVYKGDPNSGGTLLPAGGTGSNDIWFFDYSSGILNFNGTALPSGVNDTNIYIVGYRYVGSKGVSSPGAINPTNLYVSGITTTAGILDNNGGGQANTFKIEDLTAGRVVLAGTGGEIEDNSKLTFNGHELNVTGHVETDTVNVSGLSTFAGLVDINAGGQANTFKVEDLTAGRVVLAGTGGEIEDSGNLTFNGNTLGLTGAQTISSHLSVTGLSTFTGNVDANGNLDVDGFTELDDLNVSGVSTFVGNAYAKANLDVDGQTEVDDINVAGVSTFAGNIDANGDLDVDGLTNLDFVNVSAASTFGGLVDVNATLNVDGHIEADDVNVSGMTSLAQAEVGDLAANSVVYAGTGGRLKDSTNLKFTDTTSEFEVVGHSVLDTVVASGIVTAAQFSTGASGVGINISGSQITGPEELVIDPAAVGVNTGKVRIKGDLYVDGTQFVVHEGDIEFGDFVVGIASTVPTNALLDGAGIGIGSTGIRKFFRYNNASDSLQSSIGLGVLDGGSFKAGTNTVLTKTLLGPTVVNSSLTTLGTLVDLDVTGISTFSRIIVGSAVTANSTGVFVTGVTTSTSLVAGSAKISDLTDDRVVISGASGELEDSANLTFNGNTLNVVGHVETDTVNVSGLSTFAGAVDINDGGTANTFKVEDLTSGRVVLAGTGGELEDSANLKFTGSDLVVGTGVTANNTGVIVSGVTTSIGLVAGSAKVEDLTSGRVVLAGTGGELGDDADLTFTGSDLVIGTGVTANNTGVIVSGVTTSISFVGPLTGNSTTATDLSINATQRLLLQTGNNATDVLAAGNAGQVLQSAGSGSAPTWVNAASSGAIEGITVQEEGSTVGTANSISTLNFVGSAVFADAAALAGIATITVTAEDPVAMAIALG